MNSKRKAGRRILSVSLSLAILANFCNVLPLDTFADDDNETIVQEEFSLNGHRYQLIDISKSWT